MKKLLTLLIFLAGLSNANAAAVWVELPTFSLWSNTYSDSTIRIMPPAGTAVDTSQGCANPDSYMVLTTLPVEVQQRIYSTLLTAKMTGSPVFLRVQDCESNRPAVVTVRMDS